jgi:hypothetical protein
MLNRVSRPDSMKEYFAISCHPATIPRVTSRKRCQFVGRLLFSGQGCAYAPVRDEENKLSVTATALLQEGYVFDDFGSH